MKKSDIGLFTIILTKAYEYYDKKFSDSILETWWEGLEDQTIEDIEISFKLHIRNNGEFLPKISGIIQIIRGNPRDNALVQWGIVQRAACNSSSMKFGDRITEMTVRDMGGGKALGQYTKSDWNTNRNYFLDCYVAHQIQDDVDKAVIRSNELAIERSQKLIGN